MTDSTDTGRINLEAAGKDIARRLTNLEGVQLATVATSGKYSDLSGLPTLGGLAAKNSITLAEVTGAFDFNNRTVAQMGKAPADMPSYKGVARQLVVNTADWHLFVMDGSTAGGHKVVLDSDLQSTLTPYAKTADVNTAVNARVPKSGDRGACAGYETCTSQGAAVQITDSSPDTIAVTAAVAVTVANGTAGRAYTKNVLLVDAGATVSAGDKWKWMNGKVPEMKTNSLLVAKWCGTMGVLSLIYTE